MSETPFEERERLFLEELTHLSRKYAIEIHGCSGLWFHTSEMEMDSSGWEVPYSLDSDGCIDFWEMPSQTKGE